MKRIVSCLIVCTVIAACSEKSGPDVISRAPDGGLSLQGIARMLSELPIGSEHLEEVYDAARASSANGYDEEYLMRDIFESPGRGVGDDLSTRAGSGSSYTHPLRDLISDYLEDRHGTKAGTSSAEDYIKALEESGYQLYIPYSDLWDGKTFPIITFDPGYGAESNYGYEIRLDENGLRAVDSVYVDEQVAMSRPVWVVNTNDDSAFTPLELYLKDKAPAQPASDPVNPDTAGGQMRAKGTRRLMLKSFKMLRNYDSWFGGASEFWLKCGAMDGFSASTEAEMRLFTPSVTDFMVVVKRSQKGEELPLNSIMLTNFTNQIETLAFLVTEDDGGTSTNWKCSASVKVQSKSYGIDLDIPYRDKDDIVWRGQLSAGFLQEEDVVSGRFGDVEISFALE